LAAQASIQRLSKAADKSGVSAWAEVQKTAKEGLKMAREANDKELTAFALLCNVQALEVMGKLDEALESSWEAVALYRELGNFKQESTALLLTCRILLAARRINEVMEPANDALYLAQQTADTQYEEIAQQYIQSVEQAIGRANQPQFVQQDGGGGGGPQVPIWLQQQAQADGSGPAGGESRVQKQRQRGEAVDVRSGLAPEVIKSKIQTIAAGIMGFDDASELEMDSPFMESGLTSSSSVLLRDELMAEMQGVNLPITLVFDYPSPNAVADFIVEKTGG